MMVMVPPGVRWKPCRTQFVSRSNPVIAPDGLMLKAMVPWFAAVPAPGASNVVMACAQAIDDAARLDEVLDLRDLSDEELAAFQHLFVKAMRRRRRGTERYSRRFSWTMPCF
jgi:hypothetical protein